MDYQNREPHGVFREFAGFYFRITILTVPSSMVFIMSGGEIISPSQTIAIFLEMVESLASFRKMPGQFNISN